MTESSDPQTIDVLGNAWRRIAAGRLQGSFGQDWYQGRTIFGGLVAGVLARAGADAVGDPKRQPRSLTVQFSAPVSHGDAIATAEVARAGKHATQVSGRLTQDGTTVAQMLATFAAARDHALLYREAPMPRVPPPHELIAFEGGSVAPRFTRHFDMRFAIGAPPFSGASTPEVGGWCRLRSGAASDLVTICALLDVWPPPALSMLRAPAPGATMDLTYHFLAPLPLAELPGGAEEEQGWFLFRYRAPTIAEGYTEQHGEMWAADGGLVGRVRQMAAIF